jgi:chromosome segregation ATPase
MHMQRIYAQIEDLTFQKIEVFIKENDISRAKFLVDAIDAYLHILESGKDANPETLHHEIMELRTKENESWQEITKLKSTIKDANSTITKLQDENTKLHGEADQSTKSLTELREELILTKAEVDKWKEALRIKDGDIDYLRSHVAQLTQSISQLALPPSQEEAKKKGWWRFWRRG